MIRHTWCGTAHIAAFVVLVVVASRVDGVLGAQNNYYGKYIGKLKTLHHGVSGEVYAVDVRTLHIRDFSYDGEGPAAYFYAGDSKSPNGFGFRVNDENGTPNVLNRYRKKHITITLPDSKTLRDIAWFSVWCDEFSVNFGDVRIPKNLDFPKPQKIDPLNGVHKVSSDSIVVVDAQTLLIPNFSYDGEAPDAKFWVGQGNKPTPQGIRVPDENGKEEPLRRYDHKTIVLTLPKDMTVFDIGHFGVWCEAFTVDFGHIRIPRGLNVPPSLKMLGVSPQKRPRSLHQFQLPLEQQLVQQNTFSGGVVTEPRGFNDQTNPTLDTSFYHDQTSSHLDSERIRATTYKPSVSNRRFSARTRQNTASNNDDSSYQIIPSISLSTDQLTEQQQYSQTQDYNTNPQQQYRQTQRFGDGFVDTSSSNLNPSSQDYFTSPGSFGSRQQTTDYYQDKPAQRRSDSRQAQRRRDDSNDYHRGQRRQSLDTNYYRQQQTHEIHDDVDRLPAGNHRQQQAAQRRRDSFHDRQTTNDYYPEHQVVERPSRGRFVRNSTSK